MIKKIRNHFSMQTPFRISVILLAMIAASCRDFIEIDPPRTSLAKATVFASDATAEAAVTDIYFQLLSAGFSNGGVSSVSFLTTLSSDEQINYYGSTPQINQEFAQFNQNALQASNSYVLSLWTEMYAVIYRANAVIEGLTTSTGVSDDVRDRLTGEALFVRAFCHFYLVNLWGDVPLVTTTDYADNSIIQRYPVADIYAQIIADLQQAKPLLKSDYTGSSDERVRVNRAAAAALLARAYLFIGEWAKAEIESTEVISNPEYQLVEDLTTVMTKNNSEAIVQWWSLQYPNEIYFFYVFGTPAGGALRATFANAFEDGDLRRERWVGSVTTDDVTYFYTSKYSSFDQGAEYSTVLRLAEQYLIRAEARAHLGKVSGAQEDLNMIRHRAGLGDTPAGDETSLLDAVGKERQSELFCEWGHRWLDLKRLNVADDVLLPIKLQWDAKQQLYPIPYNELLKNPGLKGSQNPGY